MISYISWTPKKKNDNCYQHPNTDGEANRQTEGKAVFTETDYKDNAGTYLSWIEYGDEVTQVKKDAYILANPDFKFKLLSEAQANKLLEDYGTDENGNYLVTVSNFIVTDNQPKLDLI